MLDMKHCVRKLKDIRLLKLSDFSDFWADDYMKKKPGMLRTVEGGTLFRRFRRSGDKADPSLATLMLIAATAEAPNRGIMEKKAERRMNFTRTLMYISKRSSCPPYSRMW